MVIRGEGLVQKPGQPQRLESLNKYEEVSQSAETL